jgi:hypothetical protein
MAFALLILGIVTAVAGLLLAAPALIRDGSFDIAAITPGVVAIVGGLVLIGLGLAVRVLQRIEKALGARTSASAPGIGDPTAAPDPAVRIPFPAKSEADLRLDVAATSALVSTEDAALERLRVTFPKLTSAEGRSAEKTDASPAAQPVIGPSENVSEWGNKAIVAQRGNGASPAHVAPRFELKPSAVTPGNRPKGPVFKSVAEARRAAGAATAKVVAPVEVVAPPSAAETPSTREAAVEAAIQEPAAISVLKSGVVEGMAYTLYSDGSIEAQLPQGTLRFGSIAALREHIESAS